MVCPQAYFNVCLRSVTTIVVVVRIETDFSNDREKQSERLCKSFETCFRWVVSRPRFLESRLALIEG